MSAPVPQDLYVVVMDGSDPKRWTPWNGRSLEDFYEVTLQHTRPYGRPDKIFGKEQAFNLVIDWSPLNLLLQSNNLSSYIGMIIETREAPTARSQHKDSVISELERLLRRIKKGEDALCKSIGFTVWLVTKDVSKQFMYRWIKDVKSCIHTTLEVVPSLARVTVADEYKILEHDVSACLFDAYEKLV